MRLSSIKRPDTGVTRLLDLLGEYSYQQVDLSKHKWQGGLPLAKSEVLSGRVIAPPFDMGKLMQMAETDEYNAGCVEAIANGVIMHVTCQNPGVQNWIEAAETPQSDDVGKRVLYEPFQKRTTPQHKGTNPPQKAGDY